jgi:hypothetical protein
MKMEPQMDTDNLSACICVSLRLSYYVRLISDDSYVNCTPPLYPLPLRVRQLPAPGNPPAALVSPQAGRGA